MKEKEELGFSERPLKSVEISKIENAIAEALGELANEEYTVSVKKINFEPKGVLNPWFRDVQEIQILVQRKMTSWEEAIESGKSESD